MFQQNFNKWTSENEFINKFIQKSQLDTQYTNQRLEWISYNQFKNIKFLDRGGFSIIYEAIWLDGSIDRWDNDKKNWIRTKNQKVVLKSLNESSNLSDKFLNEVYN